MIRYGGYLLGLLGAYLLSYFLLQELGYRLDRGMILSFFGFVALPCGFIVLGVLHWASLVLKKLHKPIFTLTPPFGFTVFFFATLLPTLVYLHQFPRWVAAATLRDVEEFRRKMLDLKTSTREQFLKELQIFSELYYYKVIYESNRSQDLEPLRDLFLELRRAATAPALSETEVLELTEKLVKVRSQFHTAPPP